MASAFLPEPEPVQQPGLSTFIICDRVPEGCRTFIVPDSRQEPLLRAGEWVIADPADCEPTSGELFVIQWQSGGPPQVVECGVMPKLSDVDGGPLWAVGARHRGVNADALGFGKPGEITGDFPYRSDQLEERFLGKVVGIFEPASTEPTRIAA